ncbi:hypothetical protein [Prevotella dentasini]|uniref:hypothetical protein n=1 Tax=Prevotella dentasini TaxID=589537 RepID=UPI000568853C|nr:hypothetical protein [Prevotella dentasini]
MKLERFRVSPKADETMNWALGIALAAYALSFLDNYFSPANDGQEPLVQLFASAVNPDVLSIVEMVLKLGGTLVIMENLRRCLVREGRYFLQLAVVLLMVLMTLLGVVGCLPDGTVMDAEGTVSQTALGVFQNRFFFWDSVAIFLNEVFLGVGLMRFYAGLIRLYGLSLFCAPLLAQLGSFGVYYVYTEVGGVTMNTIQTLASINNYASVVLAVLPLVLMRLSMQVQDVDGLAD